jgi:paxillin
LKRNEKRVSITKASLDASREFSKMMESLSQYKSEHDTNSSLKSDIYKTNSTYSDDDDFSEHYLCTSADLKNKKNKSSFISNKCFGCHQLIDGQVINALGYLWHPDHFVCFHCKRMIGTSIFYEKDNRPYCEDDYLDLFSPKCGSCEKPILDKMLTALDKSWHINCFTCCSCSKPLNDESFLEINSKAYCKSCYENELAPKCKRCDGAIVENFISALNSYWHPNCFVCTECSVPFNSSSFYEHLNMPYCEMHYHTQRGSVCATCQQPINGRCVTAMNKKFHTDHFTCSFCQKHLNKGTFKEKNEKPFCTLCFQKLFPL